MILAMLVKDTLNAFKIKKEMNYKITKMTEIDIDSIILGIAKMIV